MNTLDEDGEDKMSRELISKRVYKNDDDDLGSYEVRTEQLTGDDAWGGKPFTMQSAYTLDGIYLGNPKDAHYYCIKRGIQPTVAKSDNRVCSIGFCPSEQKWYGWSHRAIYGYGIGHIIKKGSSGITKDIPVGFKIKT